MGPVNAKTQPRLDKASYVVKAGPSKFDLMLALFDSTRMFTRPVSFTVGTTKQWKDDADDQRDSFYLQHNMVIDIASVAKEDGSGETWIIEGCVNPIVEDLKRGYTRVRIYYGTRTRDGHLRFCHFTPLPPTFPGTEN